MSEQHSQVIIVGTGPAGYTAAIYCGRAQLAPLVIDGTQPGGQLTTTTDVENYPGFPEGVQGPELMERFRSQAARFGARFLSASVSKVELRQRPFVVHVDDGTRCTADALIIATGASAKYIGLESERKLLGFGVSACATCDGFFYRDKEVVVVGGGDTAVEEATFLTRFATKVTIIHRRDELRASKIMQARALENPKITMLWDSVVEEVLGNPQQGGVTGVRVRNVKTNAQQTIACHGMFVAIGHQPNTAVFSGQLEMDSVGYLKLFGGSRTSVGGVFAAGDVADPNYRQAVTAAGSGCMAAIDAERYLAER